MKNWLVNLLLGYDLKERLDSDNRTLKRAQESCAKRYDKITELSGEIKSKNSDIGEMRTKYHKLECDNLEKQNKIVELSEELELAIESINIQKVMSDTRLEAKERLEEELEVKKKEMSELRIKCHNLEIKEIGWLDKEVSYNTRGRIIEDLKKEVEKLKKINQEMSGKKRGVK